MLGCDNFVTTEIVVYLQPITSETDEKKVRIRISLCTSELCGILKKRRPKIVFVNAVSDECLFTLDRNTCLESTFYPGHSGYLRQAVVFPRNIFLSFFFFANRPRHPHNDTLEILFLNATKYNIYMINLHEILFTKTASISLLSDSSKRFMSFLLYSVKDVTPS